MLGKVAKQQHAASKISCRGSSLRVYRAARPAPVRHQPGQAAPADLLSCRSVTSGLLSQCSLGSEAVGMLSKLEYRKCPPVLSALSDVNS